MGIMKRRVAPDSPQSTGSLALESLLTPLTLQMSAEVLTFAPNALVARRVAFVSSDSNGFETLDMPFDKAAAMSIRWVYAFDGGEQILPPNRLVGWTVTSVNLCYHRSFLLVQISSNH